MKDKSLGWVLLLVGGIWLRSGIQKWISGGFPEGLGETLSKFASKNPYPWYKQILNGVISGDTTTLGYVIQSSEVLVGMLLLLGAMRLVRMGLRGPEKKAVMAALLVGGWMNLNFWLASGWTGPASESLNLLMLGLAVVGFSRLVVRK